MTQLQYLPELLLAVLFSIQASFTHPGVLTSDKEKLGDDELRAIVKRTQTSSEAREILAFNSRVWSFMTETLRAGCDELVGCEHDEINSSSPGGSNTTGGGIRGGGGSRNGVGEQTCTCKDRRDKMYLLPKVWELVILGRNLLATKERGQDLAAESKFEEEVRRLCEICVRYTEKESYHKVLITCLQFLNNLISGNEKRKMSLWMHLFVPGSTRLLEAAKRKAVKQYQNSNPTNQKDQSSSTSSSSTTTTDKSKVTPQDILNYAKDLQLQDSLKNPSSSNKLSFVTMLPTILNAKEMLPLLLIIHGSITDIEGTDPARQLMRCKMMLAAEAGIGLMAGLLMFVDAWHEIDDHIYFELILEIMETILHNGLITYLFETLKEYVDCRNYQFEGIHAITPPQAVILRLLHTIYAPAALPTITDPGVYINYDGKLDDHPPKPLEPQPPEDDFAAEFTAALKSDLKTEDPTENPESTNFQPQEDDAATEVDVDHSEATPEIVNFLAVKVLKGQLGPAVRDMITKIGKATGYSYITNTSSLTTNERITKITEIPTDDGRSITSVAGITIYDIELHYEGLIQLLELLMLFAEQSTGRAYLRETKCIEELVVLLQCLVEFVPRTTIKDRKNGVKGQNQQQQVNISNVMECNDPVEFRWPLIKRTIIQLLSLLTFGSKESQDDVRRFGGIVGVLGCFNIDEENPYIQQHATLCIRNLMEGNLENQKVLKELEAKEVVGSDALEEAGLEAYVDKQGKIKVGSGKKKKKGKK